MIINFKNVGRSKKNWTVECNSSIDSEIAERFILNQIKKNGGLMSRDIQFTIDNNHGSIFAGFHVVGEIEVIE